MLPSDGVPVAPTCTPRRSDSHRITVGCDVVYPNSPRTVHRGERADRRRGDFAALRRTIMAVRGEQRTEEALARRPDEHRETEIDQRRQRVQ